MQSLSTVEKAIDLLFHLHHEDAPRGATAVGRALDLPKSTAHRLLSTLTRRGLLERDARGQYGPGIGLVALGLGFLDREPAVVAARPVLEFEAQQLDVCLFSAVDEAAAAAEAMRVVEGESLERELGGRLDSIASLVEELESRSSLVQEAVRERLRRRTDQLRQETGLIDEARRAGYKPKKTPATIETTRLPSTAHGVTSTGHPV